MFIFIFLFLIGEAHSLKVEKILYKGKSEFQEILVFEVWDSCLGWLHLVVYITCVPSFNLNFLINDVIPFYAVLNLWKSACS